METSVVVLRPERFSNKLSGTGGTGRNGSIARHK